MAATQIILKKGQVLITQYLSQLDIVLQNTTYLTGQIVQVSDLEDMYAVGDMVTYDPQGAQNLKYGASESYTLTTNDKILYREGSPL